MQSFEYKFKEDSDEEEAIENILKKHVQLLLKKFRCL